MQKNTLTEQDVHEIINDNQELIDSNINEVSETINENNIRSKKINDDIFLDLLN
jgi:hypothetical protein